MIPVRLELKNFMSYGLDVPPLDFTGMNLACLSGENGHGKSALLDAVTWALWGEARASADELVRMGADEMRVIFDFQLGDDLYRVIRGRTKRNSSSLWEVYIADGADEPQRHREHGEALEDGEDSSAIDHQPSSISHPDVGWKPITGQGIRDTGRVIERILRMDYKTFINSAYIQQGRADEFTKQTVSDRKKILADILDLNRYDLLEQKAKARRSEADARLQDLEREIANIEAQLASEETWRKELAESEKEQSALEKKIARAEADLLKLRSKHSELTANQKRLEELRRSIESWQGELTNLESQRSNQEARISRSREVLRDKDAILAGEAKLQKAKTETARLDAVLEQLRTLTHEQAGLRQQIESEAHKLDLERRSLEKELADLQTRLKAAGSLEKDVGALRIRVGELDELASRRTELQQQQDELTDTLGSLKARRDSLAESKPDLEEKSRLISEPGAKCPLCHTELGEHKHEEIIADYQSKLKEADLLIREVTKQGSEVKARRDGVQREIAAVDGQLKAGLEDRKRLAQMEQLLAQSAEARERESAVSQAHDQLRKTIADCEFALDERNRLAEVENQTAGLKYDEDAHHRLKEELAGLEAFAARAIELKHAEENLPADEAGLKNTVELIAARTKSIEDGRLSADELTKSLEALPALNTEIKTASDSIQTLRTSDREITGRIATLRQSISKCEALRIEVSEKLKSVESARRDKSAYTELAAAFGKKGVQALIIENAVPEIQEEANNLLARMTDNAMQISIETVRDKKTGGMAETLDIRIADEMGTRSYDLFSGGEAFRINFALRIALSKLLARRAGARLQTLIIDEGFGSQDAKGREKLVEAIDSVRDDFEFILVITHIDELRDAFPTRIEVTKDSSGSRISVM